MLKKFSVEGWYIIFGEILLGYAKSASKLLSFFLQKYAHYYILNVQPATSLMTFWHQKAALSHVFQICVQ